MSYSNWYDIFSPHFSKYKMHFIALFDGKGYLKFNLIASFQTKTMQFMLQKDVSKFGESGWEVSIP